MGCGGDQLGFKLKINLYETKIESFAVGNYMAQSQ